MSSRSDYSEDNSDGSDVEYIGDQQDEEEDEDMEMEASESDADQLENDVVIDVDESEYIDECGVNENQFDFIKRLGSGAYGTVFLVKKNCGIDCNKIYAIKVISKEVVVKNAKTIVHMKAERKVLELVRGCPYIPKLYYAFQTAEKLFLVLDYIPGGEMFTLLQKGSLDENRVRIYIAELIVALEVIHKHGIVYRGIKLENIMIGVDGHVMLVDFGLCKKLGPRGRSKSFCGTVEYMAPEIISCAGHNTSADWWAIGVLAIELLTASTPFGTGGEAVDSPETMNRITSDNPTMPPNISHEMEDFILKMLIKDPTKRLGGSDLSATQIKWHPLFRDIDWDKLERKQTAAPDVPYITHPYDTQHFSEEFTNLAATYLPTAVPPQTFLTFKGYSYIAPELNETANPVNYPTDDDDVASWSWDIYSNREPNSEFDLKYRFASTQPIGTGRTSLCMKCINLQNNNCYAVKIYKKDDECTNQIDVLVKAAAKKLPGILNLVEVLRDSKWTYLIMELVTGVNLLSYLSNPGLSGKSLYVTFVALCEIVKSVHSLKYAHGRICFKNIIYNDNLEAWRIIGFSNAIPISAQHEEYIDYWSIGVCLYTALCGHAPFAMDCDLNTNFKIERGDFNQESFKWNDLKKPTKKLIDQLLCSPNPTLNPAADLKCIMGECYSTVTYSKERLDDNENIVSLRAARVQTQPVDLRTSFNGLDINGTNSCESPQSASVVQESQANHDNITTVIPTPDSVAGTQLATDE